MKITDALRGEHGAFYALFDQVEAVSQRAGAIAQLVTATAVLNALITSHAAVEEEFLFNAVESVLPNAEPLRVMRAEHDEIERSLEIVEDAITLEDAVDWILHALGVARDHFKKEEMVFFPLADRVLGDDKLEELGRSWAESRGVALVTT